ncbi:unnamed protein product [Effrenium voratum]|nr:unnamed protein product [Effrenium voratum]
MLSETIGRVRLKIDAVTRFCDQTGCCSKDGPGEGADFATGNNCFGSINDGVFGTDNGWIPGTAQYNGKTFVGVRFQEPSWIYGFRISCATGYPNLAETEYVEYTTAANPGIDTPASEWCPIRSIDRSHLRFHPFELGEAIWATGFRLTLSTENCVEEMAVYANSTMTSTTMTTTMTMTVVPGGGVFSGASTSMFFGLSFAMFTLCTST